MSIWEYFVENTDKMGMSVSVWNWVAWSVAYSYIMLCVDLLYSTCLDNKEAFFWALTFLIFSLCCC
jgi:hypothetical protein